MYLLNNITNFVDKVIEMVRQAVYSLCVGLHIGVETRGMNGFIGIIIIYFKLK